MKRGATWILKWNKIIQINSKKFKIFLFFGVSFILFDIYIFVWKIKKIVNSLSEMHLVKPITFKSKMKMNLSQKEKYMNTSNILRWLWGVRGEGSNTYSSRVEEDLISNYKSMHSRMHPFIMQEDIHEYKLPSKHIRKFLHVLRGLQICFWIQYYDESSVLLLISIIPFDDNLPKVWSTQTWVLLVHI